MAVPSIEGVLEAVGVSAQEEAVYLAVLDTPSASAAAVMRTCSLTSDREAAEVLRALEGRGLVSRLPTRPTRYRATPPATAVELLVLQEQDELRRREAALQRTRLAAADLTERHRRARARLGGHDLGEIVEVLLGRDAISQRYSQLVRGAQRLVALDRPPYVTTDPEAAEQAEAAELARGLSFRVVYDPEAITGSHTQHIRRMADAGERSRVGPVPIKATIADEKTAILPYTLEDTTDIALVVHASPLLDALVALFERVWEGASPLTGSDAADAELSPAAQQLMMLLAAGHTDAAVARELSMHPHTVQKRVAEFMRQTGVRSRFQLGVLAARRGWLAERHGVAK